MILLQILLGFFLAGCCLTAIAAFVIFLAEIDYEATHAKVMGAISLGFLALFLVAGFVTTVLDSQGVLG